MSTIPLTQSYYPAQEQPPVQDWTVGDLLRAAVAQAPERVAIKQPGKAGTSCSYQQLEQDSHRVARALLRYYQPGDRLAVWATNKPEWVLLQMGAALAGIVLVTLNPANREEELKYLLSQSQALGLFLDREFRQLDNQAVIETLSPALPHLQHQHYFDEWDAFVDGALDKQSLPQISPDDPVLILYTSGTTGKPKGVVLTHRGVVNNGRFGSSRYEIEPGAVWLNPLPMFHVGGSITMTLGCLANLGTQVVLPGFDPELMLRSIHEDRVQVTMAVPTMLNAMFEHERFSDTSFDSLELLVTGGTTIPPEIITETRAKLGVDVEVIFGQTEAGGVMAQSRRGDSDDHICNTVGTPFPSYAMKIISTESGQVQPVDTIGEICVRSPCTMKEYFNMPDKTAETIDSDGWVHTGDLGKMRTDGYVQITGRLKDMIIRGGENIYPREIEDKLIEHPDVAEVAVFGVPDTKWGENVVAAVRLEAGAALRPEELMAFLEGRLARHKIPRQWQALEAMPVNASGKIMKFALRDQYLAQA
jgi:fatty-acyl-CoA synthase